MPWLGFCNCSSGAALKVQGLQEEKPPTEKTSFLSSPKGAELQEFLAKPISSKNGEVDMSEMKVLLPMLAPVSATQSQMHPIILDLNCTKGGSPGGSSTRNLVGMEPRSHSRGQVSVSVCAGSGGCTILLVVLILGLVGLALFTVFALPDPTIPPGPAVGPAAQAAESSSSVTAAQPSPAPSQHLAGTPSASQEFAHYGQPPAHSAFAPASETQTSRSSAAVLQFPSPAPAELLASQTEEHDCSLKPNQDASSWPHDKRAWCCDKWGRGCPSMFQNAPRRLRPGVLS